MRTSQQRRDRTTDRWIDLIAASYGMPRVVLLREMGTMPHLARAVAALIAADQRAEAERNAVAQAKQKQEEDEMRAYLAELKAEQDAMRAEQGV
jgi:hypothetical protein